MLKVSRVKVQEVQRPRSSFWRGIMILLYTPRGFPDQPTLEENCGVCTEKRRDRAFAAARRKQKKKTINHFSSEREMALLILPLWKMGK